MSLWLRRVIVPLLISLCHLGLEASMAHERRPPMAPSSASRYHRRRSSGTRDERYRSGESTAGRQHGVYSRSLMSDPMILTLERCLKYCRCPELIVIQQVNKRNKLFFNGCKIEFFF